MSSFSISSASLPLTSDIAAQAGFNLSNRGDITQMAKDVMSGDKLSDAEGLKKVAQGFEAVFLRQILSEAGKADFGGENYFGSSGEDTFTEMRNARYAEIASSSGSLGFAAQIEAQLSRHLNIEGEG